MKPTKQNCNNNKIKFWIMLFGIFGRLITGFEFGI